MEAFDLIIIGAGPAGLSLAAELAGHLGVLVIERGEIGRTSASWYSYGDRVREHGLDDAVAFQADHLLFKSPNLTHRMVDECVVLNQDRVLQIWLERARTNGAEFVQGEFQRQTADRDGVTVQTSAGHYRARLLVDCMGPRSPIVQEHNLIRRKDTWVLSGARVRLAEPLAEPEIAYLPLNDEANSYIGIHPFSPLETNIYLFQGQPDTFGDPDSLAPLFRQTLAQRYPGAEIMEPIGGRITSGVLRRYALPRVIFFGAAGMMNPDAIGMGFNEVLRQVRCFARRLEDALTQDQLDLRHLERIAVGTHDQEAMHFQRIIGAFSLHFSKSESKWDGGVRWLNALGSESKTWMRNELTPDWIRRATLKLHRAVPIRETLKMIPAKDLLFIGEQLLRFLGQTLLIGAKHRLGDARKRLFPRQANGRGQRGASVPDDKRPH
jgi:2-polyprenyl-6-methoxyphenol hydroxylase-like FAD-dependent oxidoreductase